MNHNQIKYLKSLTYLKPQELKRSIKDKQEALYLLHTADAIVLDAIGNDISKMIVIQDWAGNLLFVGNYEDEQVDHVLDANRCDQCHKYAEGECEECDDTGYSGDFEVYWVDPDNKENVYEYINY